jgi:hypothetical protein
VTRQGRGEYGDEEVSSAAAGNVDETEHDGSGDFFGLRRRSILDTLSALFSNC